MGEVGDGIFEVLATAGDTNLGGEDFKKQEGINLLEDIQALQRLTEAAEKAKMELSTVEKTGPKHIEKELSREIFEELCQELIDRCRIPVEKSINDARLDKSDISEVVLVGGSTRIPAIQRLVESITNKKP